jgi:hypothetical protein
MVWIRHPASIFSSSSSYRHRHPATHCWRLRPLTSNRRHQSPPILPLYHLPRWWHPIRHVAAARTRHRIDEASAGDARRACHTHLRESAPSWHTLPSQPALLHVGWPPPESRGCSDESCFKFWHQNYKKSSLGFGVGDSAASVSDTKTRDAVNPIRSCLGFSGIF